jgi:cytochrome c oxidase assembly protein subunit 15
MQDRSYNRPLHIVAALTALATFPLIFMGGLVTTKGVGMSVPDWPNSYGYNMFLFPPSQWVGGIFYEHTHRLMGTVVGFLSIVLVLLAWSPASKKAGRFWIAAISLCSFIFALISGMTLLVIYGMRVPNVQIVADRSQHFLVGAISLLLIGVVAWRCRRPEPRPWVRWLCTAVFLAICLQGALGGFRVVLVELGLAIVHGIFAQTVFCLVAFTALATGPDWRGIAANSESPVEHRPSVLKWAIAAFAVVYLQLIAGALMRHNEAGLAIPDVPLNYGHWLPPMNDAELNAANLQRATSGESILGEVTLTQVWLHFAHRVGAVLVTVVVTIAIVKLFRSPGDRAAGRKPAWFLVILLPTQITLGIITVLLRKPADIATLHVACGALVLLMTFLLAARLLRARYRRPAGFMPVVAAQPPPTADFTTNRRIATA